MKWLALILLSTFAFPQAVMQGGSRSSGGATYSTKGATSGGGGNVSPENVYCPPGSAPELIEGVPNWGVNDGPAAFPVRCMNTALTSTPSPGGTVQVAAGDSAGLTSALNNAVCGTTITLVAGSTYVAPAQGFSVKPNTCTGSQWITIRSTGVTDSRFPAEGVRATPCIAGISNDATNGFSLPGYPSYPCPYFNAATPVILSAKIQQGPFDGNPALSFEAGASHYRFIGIEFTKNPTVSVAQIVRMSLDNFTGGANHIIFDRVLCHGDAFTPTLDAIVGESNNCFRVSNTTWVALINSWAYDTFCTVSCVDSHIYSGGTGVSADGPHKLWNNLLATAAESFIFGGGGPNPPGTFDFEFRGNHSFHPLTWMIPIDACPVILAAPIVKNLGEFKDGVGAFLEGNVFENNWPGCQSDQNGFAFLLNPSSQGNFVNITVTYDGTNVVTTPDSFTFPPSPSLPPGSPVDVANCAPGGCVLEDTGQNPPTVFHFCNGANGCNQNGIAGKKCASGASMGNACTVDGDCAAPFTGICAPTTTARICNPLQDPSCANGTTTTVAGARKSNSCIPGDCPQCRLTNLIARFNEIYNENNGISVNSGTASHCHDEASGLSNVSIHDNRIHGLSTEMTNGVDPQADASCITIASNTNHSISNIEISHNTCAIEKGNSAGLGGLGRQADRTDIQTFSNFNIHDNVAPAPWHVTHTGGAIVNKGLNGQDGLANAFQTDSCAHIYPVEAPLGIVGSVTQNFTFTPSLTTYFVTVNGSNAPLSVSTPTSFSLSNAATAGDGITVRDLTSCPWTFKGNLLGTNLPGSAKDYAPYPDGTFQASANNSTNCGISGTSPCILDNAAFTGIFANWGTGRTGDFTITSPTYVNSASDAATRPATGKSPGADLTTLAAKTNGVATATNLATLSITSTTITPGTHNVPYVGLLGATAGASLYKGWFRETDPANCSGGDCGALPANSGILVGRSGTVNGPFTVQTVVRAVTTCGTLPSTACSTFTIEQSLSAGLPQIGQTVVLSQFADGDPNYLGTATNTLHDSTFNGTCVIAAVTPPNKFQCAQTGTGFDTIASHTPNDLWQGQWQKGGATSCTIPKSKLCYKTGQQVIFGIQTYVSLQNDNQGHQPDISPTFWSTYTLPPNQETGAFATFAPITPGTYNWWMGVRDGAFQVARAQITMVVN